MMRSGGLVLLGCFVATVVAGCNGHAQTVAENRSDRIVIVHATNFSTGVYVALIPGATAVVDAGPRHPVPAAQAIFILGMDCVVQAEVTGDFSQGGVVTVQADGSATFSPGRQVLEAPWAGRDELGYTSCADAVGAATN